MLYHETLNEIRNNINTGVEYEIALFYRLLEIQPLEQEQVLYAIMTREDFNKISKIIKYTDTAPILTILKERDLALIDVSFETQNDTVGPADIVMSVENLDGERSSIGLSVKYANSCSLNVTSRNFLSEEQISKLKGALPYYTDKYITEMTGLYGEPDNWFRKRKPSTVTDKYIDLIRDEVISNWENISDKTRLISALFHGDSPIEFWIVTYDNKKYSLNTKPLTIDIKRANEITVDKYQTSYVAFYLDGKRIGHMQIKFNNGFVEKCKKRIPDIIYQGVRMSYGQPFSSWNFNLEK